MNKYLILTIIIAIIAIIVLVYVSSYLKLKKYKEKMDKAEEIIDKNLDKKLDVIIAINSQIKKVINKKDYLKDYTTLKDSIITNIEKYLKLEEAVKLINDLSKDFVKINNDKEFIKNVEILREIDELLVSAKDLFNQNAMLSNELIKTFPYSLISKTSNFKIRSYYTTNNKNDDNDNF